MSEWTTVSGTAQAAMIDAAVPPEMAKGEFLVSLLDGGDEILPSGAAGEDMDVTALAEAIAELHRSGDTGRGACR